MAIEEFRGREYLRDAAVSALSGSVSAVKVTGVEPVTFTDGLVWPRDEKQIVRAVIGGLSLELLSDAIVSSVGPQDGRQPARVLYGGYCINGGSGAHVDAKYRERPLYVSVGYQGDARWRTQMPVNPGPACEQRRSVFDATLPIDECTQAAGEIVMIPHGSMHEIIANQRRKATVIVVELTA